MLYEYLVDFTVSRHPKQDSVIATCPEDAVRKLGYRWRRAAKPPVIVNMHIVNSWKAEPPGPWEPGVFGPIPVPYEIEMGLV